MRVRLAQLLVRAGCTLLAGRDDRVVILNTQRKRVSRGDDLGRIKPFITNMNGSAASFPPDAAVAQRIGVPMPSRVAKLAGYSVEPIGL